LVVAGGDWGGDRGPGLPWWSAQPSRPRLAGGAGRSSARAGDVFPGTYLRSRDQKFESAFLQRGVTCEPVGGGGSSTTGGSSGRGIGIRRGCRALDLPCSAGEFFLDHARVGLNFGGTFWGGIHWLRAAEFRDAGADSEADCCANG
jgi:hypothetical protein